MEANSFQARRFKPQLIDGLGYKKIADQSLPAELFWSAIDARRKT